MPDGKIWFAQNLNYTKDLTFNLYAREANGKQFTSTENGIPAIGSYWCPGADGGTYSGNQNTCNIYGALYTWETAMMIDGKYADETKTSSAWDESWISDKYYTSGAPGKEPNADKNNARGGNSVKGGGRGICPMGWHIPTDLEWAQLLDKVDGVGTSTVFADQTGIGWIGADAGLKLKSAATFTGSDVGNGAWRDHANRGTAKEFDVTPAGCRGNPTLSFTERGDMSVQRTSTPASADGAWYRSFRYQVGGSGRFGILRHVGMSVRCLKN
jgi:uncharacterized protein (TIGR02145 family)